MRGEPGLFDIDERLKRLEGLGDPLLGFARVVDFEIFRPELEKALAYANGTEGGRPPLDCVMMFKVLVVQAANNLSDDRTEFLVNDRLSFMRFLGLALADKAPDAKTIWAFRERLTRAGAIEGLFKRFDDHVKASDYLATSGQIVAASLIAAPKQRNTQRGETQEEKRAIKEGRVPELRQKDRDARWTVKFSKAKPKEDGTRSERDLAIPHFGYKNHVSIDRGGGLIRRWLVTDASAYDGARLREGLIDKQNTASGVWADTAYRSAANERFLEKNGFRSFIHRKKPKGRPMSAATAKANALKSKVRAAIEHVFADQKDRMDLFIRTIGLARARVKIGMANLVYNFRRLGHLQRRALA
jgi:transposase, IS5 family